MSTILGNGGDTINISYSSLQIKYNINGGIDTVILPANWPVTIQNLTPGSGILKVIFTTDITLNNINYFFICGSPNIQFGDTSLKPDGTRPIITIDNVPGYGGLMQNGDFSNAGNDNIYIFNLFVKSTGTTTLANSGGWIGTQYFSKGAQENYIISCLSDGDIIYASGGIVGANAGLDTPSNLTIRGCSSYGSIGEACGGIVGVDAAINSGIVNINQCFSIGVISDYAGGIVGGSGGIDGGFITVTNCYSTGNINGTDAGGIFGDNAGVNDGVVVVQNCYSQGTIASGSAGIFGSGAGGGIPGSVTADNCYSSGSINPGGYGIYITGDNVTATNTYIGNGGWNDITAQTQLTGFGTLPTSTWLSLGLNIPFILNNFGITPYNLNDILPSLDLNQNYSQTVLAGNSTISGVVAGNKNFRLLGSDNPSYASYFTILDAPSYTGGSITVSTATPGGVYVLIVYAVDDYTTTLFTITVIPAPILRVREIPPCCEPNVPEPNPQTTNYNSNVIVNKKAGKTMDSSVANYYEGYATGEKRGFTKPVFKSYHDYINYLQGKYK